MLWAIAAWFVGLAAYLHRRWGREAEKEGSPRHARSTGIAAMGAVALAYGLLVIETRPHWDEPLGGLVFSAALLAILVMARQFVALRENARLQAEQATLATEARFRSLVQNASDIILVADAAGDPALPQPLGRADAGARARSRRQAGGRPAPRGHRPRRGPA